MRTIKYLFIFIFFVNCQNKKNETKISAIDSASIKKDTIIEKESDFENKINDSLYLIKKENRESYCFLYYSKDKKENVSFDSLVIKNKQNNGIQKINIKKNYFLFPYEITFSANEDINFDGYKDIQLVNYVGNYNSSHSYWIYKNKTKKYKHIIALDSVYNPGFDSIKKQIYSEWRVALQEFHSENYFWRNDEVILKEEKIKNYVTGLEDSINLYTKKLVNGKYIIKEEIVENNDKKIGF